MTGLYVTWKPPLTHLRYEDNAHATLCGVATPMEWEDGEQVTVHDVIAERAAGCLRCKRIAESRMAAAVDAERVAADKEHGRRNPPRGYLIRNCGGVRMTWVSATDSAVAATRTWDHAERAACVADAWRHFEGLANK